MAVATDQLLTDRDLDGVTGDGDLDLAAIGVSDAVVRPGEGHVAGRVDLRVTDDGARREARPPGALHAGGLLVGRVAAVVGGDEHAAVVDVHEPAIAGDLDGLPSASQTPAL